MIKITMVINNNFILEEVDEEEDKEVVAEAVNSEEIIITKINENIIQMFKIIY